MRRIMRMFVIAFMGAIGTVGAVMAMWDTTPGYYVRFSMKWYDEYGRVPDILWSLNGYDYCMIAVAIGIMFATCVLPAIMLRETK